jgi:hypothetical protein
MKAHFFHGIDKRSDQEFLVKAPRASAATAAIIGARIQASPATPSDLVDLISPDTPLHPASRPGEERGTKLFAVTEQRQGQEPARYAIRAKNPADVAALVVGDGLEVKKADQDTLVRLLTQGVSPIDAMPADKPATAPSGGDGGHEANSGDGHETLATAAQDTPADGQSTTSDAAGDRATTSREELGAAA